MDIQTEHMKQRGLFISAMCFVSLFCWCRYSLFDPIENSVFTPYYQNGLFMLMCQSVSHFDAVMMGPPC